MTSLIPGDRDGFRRNNFDFARFALAVLVIFSHCWPVLHGTDATEPLSRLTGGRLTFGAVAVDGFFVISGFLIAGSWFGCPRVAPFLRKRVARIYPGYVAAVFLTVPIVWFAWSGPARFPAKAMLLHAAAHAVGVPNPLATPVFPHNPMPVALNASLWTLWYEFACYLMLAALGLSGLLGRGRVVAGICALSFCVYIAQILAPGRIGSGPWLAGHAGDLANWSRFVTFFLAGALVYRHGQRLPRSGLLLALALGCLGGSLLVRPWLLPLLLPLCGTYALFWFAYARAGLCEFGRFGDFSYGIYIYAFPIQQMVVARLGPSIGALRLFVTAGLLSIIAGALSWHLVERRFLRNRGPASRPATNEAHPRPCAASPAPASAPTPLDIVPGSC